MQLIKLFYYFVLDIVFDINNQQTYVSCVGEMSCYQFQKVLYFNAKFSMTDSVIFIQKFNLECLRNISLSRIIWSGIYFSSWYLNFLILIDILIQDIQCKWIRILDVFQFQSKIISICIKRTWRHFSFYAISLNTNHQPIKCLNASRFCYSFFSLRYVSLMRREIINQFTMEIQTCLKIAT